MVFSHKRALNTDVTYELHIGNETLEKSNVHKFLGVYID